MSVNIKSLINALFKLSGSQAMPGGSNLNFTQAMQPNSKFDWVAPNEGYITVTCNNSFFWMAIQTAFNGVFSERFSIYSDNGLYSSLSYPCSKGQTVRITVGAATGKNENYEVYIKYTNTIGAS